MSDPYNDGLRMLADQIALCVPDGTSGASGWALREAAANQAAMTHDLDALGKREMLAVDAIRDLMALS